jgi:hypothetical protein
MPLFAIAVYASAKIPPMRDDIWKDMGYEMCDVRYLILVIGCRILGVP